MGKSILVRFVLINVAVFIAVHIAALCISVAEIDLSLIRWLELPPVFMDALTLPWTFITYMFTHYDIWHILFNLLWLYCFGLVFLDHFSERDFIIAYFSGGIAGAIFYLSANAIFPQIASNGLLGASAAVLSIAAATVTRAPNYHINLILIGMVKIKWIAVACIAIALLTVGTHNIGGHIAHVSHGSHDDRVRGVKFVEPLRRLDGGHHHHFAVRHRRPPAGGRAAARLPARELPLEAGGGRGGELRLRLPHEPRARRARLR